MPTEQKTVIDDYRAEFEAGADTRKGEPSWLVSLRSEAMDLFATTGFPSTKREDWKYNDLRALSTKFFQGPNADAARQVPDLSPWLFEGLDSHLLVFVDGLHTPALSHPGGPPAGASIATFAELREGGGDPLRERLGRIAGHEERPFTALGTAFLRDGVFLRLEKGVRLERPLHILWLSAGGAAPTLSSPRLLVSAGEGSRATIIESFAGQEGASYLTNTVSEIDCGPGAEIEHIKLQRESEAGFHVGRTAVRQAAASLYRSREIALGGEMARRELDVRLEGEGARCELDALYLARGRQRLDNRTRVTHAVPGCETRELYKGILDEQGHGIFDGLILVERDAQQTDARQTNRNLLLSDDAVADSMPRLEIYADDVKCTHGSTTGQLADEQLHYLRSRGFDPDAARALLTFAFAREIIDGFEQAPLQSRLGAELLRRLPRGELIEEAL